MKRLALVATLVVLGCGEGSSANATVAPDARADANVEAIGDAAPDANAEAIGDATAPRVDAASGGDGGPGPGTDAGAPRDAASTADAGAGAPRDAAVPIDGAFAADGGSADLIGYAGIAAWLALPAAERARVDQARAAFLHKSVGQDLEDGVEANGFRFDYVTSADTVSAPGLSGGIFDTSNGNGLGKIAEWRAFALRNGATRLRVTIMKFGYADVEGDLGPIQSAYASATAAIRAAGMRVLHVTPPLVYNAPTDNASKAAMRAWMLATFPGDVIFDLDDAESIDPVTGARCERGGAWEICDRVRSTSTCPSAGQGVDAPSGQGHLCAAQAARIAKGFLYAIARASR